MEWPPRVGVVWQMLLPWWQVEWPPRVGVVWQMLLPWWLMELQLVSLF